MSRRRRWVAIAALWGVIAALVAGVSTANAPAASAARVGCGYADSSANNGAFASCG
jgi:hypothetical protein